MEIKTEQVCSKNSRKYMNRRFRPKMAEAVDYASKTTEYNEGENM